MPAEPTSKQPKRSSSSRKSLFSDEELAIRRARGEISCAECRRLKLKCDKKLPACGSCVRRGCPSVCPNGTLSAGQGSRFILADTSELHGKITEMSHRIRQLEDALAVFQANISSERHPLLTDDLLAIKFWPNRDPRNPNSDESRRSTHVDEVVDAFGTLTLGDSGEAKYFGRSAGSEALLIASAEWDTAYQASDEVAVLPEGLANMFDTFPLNAEDSSADDIYDMLLSALPPQTTAWSLCETYFEHAVWICTVITRDEVVNEVMAPIYKHVKARESALSDRLPADISPHRLAVLFAVFALGSLVDLTLPPYNGESEKYFRLAKAALSTRSITDSPTLETVQALAILAYFQAFGGARYTFDSAWTIMSFACKIAQSIGLHRDCARWGLDAKTVQRRRQLFWSVFITDVQLSIFVGRPPSIALSYVDCELPLDEAETLDEDGQIQPGHDRWRIIMSKTIFAPLLENMLAAQPPRYEQLLDSDRKVREITPPKTFRLFPQPLDDDYRRPSACLQGYLISQFRMTAMLLIHRSFFTQALIDHPLNPFRSPFASSYLTAYRCSSIIIKSSIHYYDRCPDLLGRFTSFWTHAFSAAVVVGFVVARTPNSSIAPSAFVELNLAIALFEKGAPQHARARRALLVLRKLKMRAERAYCQSSGQLPSDTTPSLNLQSPTEDPSQKALAVFGGKTQVLPTRSQKRRSGSLSRRPTGSPSVSHTSSPASLAPSSDRSDSTQPSPPQLSEIEAAAMRTLSQLEASGFSDSSYNMDFSSMDWTQGTFFDAMANNEGTFFAEPAEIPQSVPSGYPSFETETNPPMAYSAPLGESFFGLNGSVNAAYPGLESEQQGVDDQWLSLLRDSGLLDRTWDGN